MQYIYVRWKHDFPDEPIEFYAELDDNRYEIRKIEIHRNGKIGYATDKIEINNTKLGLVQVPELNEIAKDEQFTPKEIKKEEFEDMWNKRFKK